MKATRRYKALCKKGGYVLNGKRNTPAKAAKTNDMGGGCNWQWGLMPEKGKARRESEGGREWKLVHNQPKE